MARGAIYENTFQRLLPLYIIRPAMNLIITADDFGRSSEINAAVVIAHKQGVLTSASLMVGGDAFDEAVTIARRIPTLAVGLHLVVVDGKPVLPPEQLSRVVDDRGFFPDAPVRLGLRYFFDSVARAQIEAEIAAQFEKFAQTGLRLSHVDGHQHLHLHPTIFPLLVSLAARYGAGGIRLPREPLRFALRYDRGEALTKLVWRLEFGLLSRYCRRVLRGKPLSTCDRVVGLMQSGKMEKPYVLDAIRHLRAASMEIYFHPTTGLRTDVRGPNPDELFTLIDPALREAIECESIRLCAYPDLQRGTQ
jgi:hopanoid biosynthesis associated protein HpnK